ncbi:P-loop containing nucleoside triphosphate hydrolase protein [Xylaria longipes]|nr:P-loop containing nucleoside triphosphate hydrolase protein [Xylaria longipes]
MGNFYSQGTMTTMQETSAPCSVFPNPHHVTTSNGCGDSNQSPCPPYSTAKLFEPTSSQAREEWIHRKIKGGEENEFLDKLMEYEGLEQVKQQFLDIKSKIEISKEQGRRLWSERFSVVFQGNPGTGKTTIASFYGKFLESLDVLQVEHWTHEAISGMEVVNRGSDEIARTINRMVKYEGHGGILIVDEAYQLISPQAGMTGRSALDIMLTMMENNVGKLTIIFLGYKEEMESFFEHNPGLSSRIPYTMEFDDLTDYELWKILCNQITDQYSGKMEVEGGMEGLYMRCTIRRLATGRGRKGFGNARAVQNLLSHVMQRQARRLVKERRDGEKPNCCLLKKEDLLGPDPSTARRTSQAWFELQNMVGLEHVKESVKCLIDSIEINYNRELHEFRPIAFSLNQIFIGDPGTGKTTVARLYGRILADLGYLSRGDVILKTPADFIGDCLGKSEAQTKRILEASIGKVLVVDEAYMLDPGNTNGDQDKFKTGVIDTFVSMVQGLPFEDRCIIFVGYEDKIRTMFRNANPGLSRRFPIEQPCRFRTFNSEQLLAILHSKMKDQDLVFTDEALAAARNIFEKAMIRGNHTNAGIVDSTLEMVKLNYSRRISRTAFNPQEPNPKFRAVDFDLNFPKAARVDYRKVMKGQIDDIIINQLESYHKRHDKAKEHGISSEDLGLIPTRFLFHGPPGSGKTTASRLIALLFFEMGYLSVPEVIEYSATDLIGQYVGHTGHKTREKLKDAIGRLIFIKDAHLLLNGPYETQAINELARFLSQPIYQRNVVAILEGDTEGIAQLMKRPDLSNVFSEEVAFKDISPDACMTLLSRELEHNGLACEFSFAADPHSFEYDEVKKLFSDMQSIPGWANARDVKRIASQVTGGFFEVHDIDAWKSQMSAPTLVVNCMEKMITQKKNRHGMTGSRSSLSSKPEERPPRGFQPNLSSSFMESLKHQTDAQIKVETKRSARENSGHNERVTAKTPQFRIETNHPPIHHDHGQNKIEEVAVATREEDVEDETWNRLQEAKNASRKKQARFRDLEGQRQEAADAMVQGEGPESVQLREKYEAINREYIVARQVIRQQEKIQKALRKMGRCEYGYQWTHVDGGYRCEGGFHFISDAEVYKLVDTGE